jgi:hypothetical protein
LRLCRATSFTTFAMPFLFALCFDRLRCVIPVETGIQFSLP